MRVSAAVAERKKDVAMKESGSTKKKKKKARLEPKTKR